MVGVQRAADPSNLTELEKKHVPAIKTSGATNIGEPVLVEVKVGQIPHPMKEAHYIEWIELYDGDKLASKISLKGGDAPEARFSVNLTESTRLKAVESCTIHGKWESDQEVCVVED